MMDKLKTILFYIITISLGAFLLLVLSTAIYHKPILVLTSIPLLLGVKLLLKNVKVDFKSQSSKIIFIIILSLIVKTLICGLYFPTLEADYSTYYMFAKQYTESFVIGTNTLYIALFNHVFGYSFVLSLLFSIFSEKTIVAIIFNIVVSTISSILIYLIGKKCFDEKVGFASSILWILCPSQSLWNSFVLSEPLYTCLILLIMYLLISNKEKVLNKKREIGIALLIGLLLSVFNMVRPVGIIVLIAIFIYLLFYYNSKLLFKILMFVAIFVTYSIFKLGINHLSEVRNNVNLSGFSWYNVNVGLNYDSYGQWNEEDWDRVLTNVNKYSNENEENPGLKAQEEEKKLVIDNLKEIKNPFLFIFNKVYIFIGSDDGVVEHLSNCHSFTDVKQSKSLSLLCNVYYYFLLLTSIAGTIVYIKKEKNNSNKSIIIVMLYCLGLTCGHMIAEVQPRYHYSVLLIMFFMTAYYLYNNKKEDSKKKIKNK